ncbi:hypothetical protein [Enterobacter hormaechei]|uniref:hypothetical protein n=1 Tax=Enterobacter hormaechei TaxID=158836 RepID=UPI001E2F8DA1|nr:hypothetical protein [Enterobacter hormaechei]MCC4525054.1 hypothetical protein [Enterobacter hormaechei]MCC4529139.1 hypothetical protein [Enterobacter hormaechei]MCC4534379.1 hypothetical protein [Enterobacter hormaechei]MCC4538755.1 hypothetical protein [Enterobacter hormaechei]
MKLNNYLEEILEINPKEINYNGNENTEVDYDWNTSYKDHLVQTGLVFEVNEGLLEIKFRKMMEELAINGQ